MVDGAPEGGLGASPAEKGDGESADTLLPVEPRHILVGDRSPTRIVHLALDVKSWITAPRRSRRRGRAGARAAGPPAARSVSRWGFMATVAALGSSAALLRRTVCRRPP